MKAAMKAEIGLALAGGAALGLLRWRRRRPPSTAPIVGTFKVRGHWRTAIVTATLRRVGLMPAATEAASSADDEEVVEASPTAPGRRCLFLWENTPSVQLQQDRASALVYNHLIGAEVLEDKSKLALLQNHACSGPGAGLAARAVADETEFRAVAATLTANDPGSTWILKDATANGGEGLFIFDRSNADEVAAVAFSDAGGVRRTSNSSSDKTRRTASSPDRPDLRAVPAQYVVQRYLSNPALWKGRKFHFRVYACVLGDLQCFIHRAAFLHAANKPFELLPTTPSTTTAPETAGASAPPPPLPPPPAAAATRKTVFDPEVHITNCCANSHRPELFAGEICVDLPTDYPGEFQSMLASLDDLVQTAAAPFLQRQRSPDFFEFIGIDFLLDTDGGVWLLECNCPPCSQTATGLPAAEDLHDRVARDLADLFVAPVVATATASMSSSTSPSGATTPKARCFRHRMPVGQVSPDGAGYGSSRCNGWVAANKPRPPEELVKAGNAKAAALMARVKWRAFERKCKQARAAELGVIPAPRSPPRVKSPKELADKAATLAWV